MCTSVKLAVEYCCCTNYIFVWTRSTCRFNASSHKKRNQHLLHNPPHDANANNKAANSQLWQSVFLITYVACYADSIPPRCYTQKRTYKYIPPEDMAISYTQERRYTSRNAGVMYRRHVKKIPGTRYYSIRSCTQRGRQNTCPSQDGVIERGDPKIYSIRREDGVLQMMGKLDMYSILSRHRQHQPIAING